MSNNNNSGRNRVEVPQAKEAMNKFKMEVASELGVNLKQGYNGDLTSAQAGSIGGEMVRKMIKKQEEAMAGKGNFQFVFSMAQTKRCFTTVRLSQTKRIVVDKKKIKAVAQIAHSEANCVAAFFVKKHFN